MKYAHIMQPNCTDNAWGIEFDGEIYPNWHMRKLVHASTLHSQYTAAVTKTTMESTSTNHNTQGVCKYTCFWHQLGTVPGMNTDYVRTNCSYGDQWALLMQHMIF